jgi:hypothetical protein
LFPAWTRTTVSVRDKPLTTTFHGPTDSCLAEYKLRNGFTYLPVRMAVGWHKYVDRH